MNKTNTGYKHVLNYLLSVLESSNGGERFPTHAEIGRHCKVSHMTVRKAIKILERDSLIVTNKGGGTLIRKKPSEVKQYHFLLILPSNRKDDFSGPIISGVVTECNSRKIGVSILPYPETHEKLLENLQRFQSTGVVWIAPDSNELKILGNLNKRGYLVMVINRTEVPEQLGYVSTDHEKGAEDITGFLLDKGHAKIAFVGGNSLSYMRQRFNGFLRAFQSRSLPFQEENIIQMNESNPYATLGAFKEMLHRCSPTAIFISAGMFAKPILDCLKDENIAIPEDIEIATFDEVPDSCKQKEHIHEVVQPLYQLGSVVVEEIEHSISDEKHVAKRLLPPILKEKNCKNSKILQGCA